MLHITTFMVLALFFQIAAIFFAAAFGVELRAWNDVGNPPQTLKVLAFIGVAFSIAALAFAFSA